LASVMGDQSPFARVRVVEAFVEPSISLASAMAFTVTPVEIPVESKLEL